VVVVVVTHLLRESEGLDVCSSMVVVVVVVVVRVVAGVVVMVVGPLAGVITDPSSNPLMPLWLRYDDYSIGLSILS